MSSLVAMAGSMSNPVRMRRSSMATMLEGSAMATSRVWSSTKLTGTAA